MTDGYQLLTIGLLLSIGAMQQDKKSWWRVAYYGLSTLFCLLAAATFIMPAMNYFTN